LLAAAVVSGLALVLAGQTTAPPKPKTVAAKKKKKKTYSATARKPAGKAAKKRAVPRGQMRPTPERYKEIEQALYSRGYLLETPSGKWGPSAAEALRNFQTDNELPATGRLDSHSLTQLGLGPKPY